MGSIFKPSTTVVQAPSQATTSGSSEIKPYAPVEPFIKDILPEIRQTFTAAPQLYTGSLVPDVSAQTAAARDIYGQVGQQAAAFAPDFQTLYQQRLAEATAGPGTSALYQAQVGDIANKARLMTEADKQLAQQQAIEAGQFGLGSTALRELQTLQQQKREELIQQQLATALGQEEQRRVQAIADVPGLAQQYLQAGLTPATIQEAIGKDVEARQAAQQADVARLTQQQQEAERAQLITMANLFGGLAGLGSSTQMQQTSSGTTGQVIPGTSPFQQVAGIAGTVAPLLGVSDIRLKTEIKRVGKLPNGIPLYHWEWTKEGKEIAKDQPTFGVLAQEVLKFMPEAVVMGNDGYFRVDYGKVLNG